LNVHANYYPKIAQLYQKLRDFLRKYMKVQLYLYRLLVL